MYAQLYTSECQTQLVYSRCAPLRSPSEWVDQPSDSLSQGDLHYLGHPLLRL